MVLSCKAVCTKVNKKSQSQAFKKLKENDIMTFSTEIKRAGRNSGTYATYIDCYNPQTNEHSRLSFNQLGNVLLSFEFEQID